MRLIDADALSEAMYRKSFETDDGRQRWDGGLWIRYKVFEEARDEAPTIDAVPVVRCKDCEHFADDYVDTGFGPIPAFSCDVYELYGARLSINHYCAYGEREDDATD